MHPDGDKVSEIPLWSKGQNIQVYENVGSNWYPRYEWTAIGTNGNTIDASQVRSKPILVEIPAYTTFYFYLEITDNSGVSNYGSVGDKLTSISNPVKIGVLKGLDRPSNIPEKYSSLIVGCEDAPRNSDHDFNDVVFLLTGYAPEVIYDDVLRETYIRKRYLIEDLGNTYDFDFNDIVVDVTQTTTTKWIVNTETGEVTPKEGEEPTVKQEATITYLCGTLPHQITVGNTTFGQVTDPTNLEQTKAQLVKDPSILGEGTTCAQGSIPGIYPSVTKTIENNSWDPDNNNITATIWKIASPAADPTSTTGVWTSTFPSAGEVPYIIAVDQDKEVMSEGQHIPESWMAAGDMSTKE